MDTFHLEATDRTPKVSFHKEKHTLEISGESFPEDVSRFYQPLLEKMELYFSALENTTIHVRMELVYFNSFSAKSLMLLFDLLEDTARRGNTVHLEWHYEEGDETIQEFGEDYADTVRAMNFQLCPHTAEG
jgi:hypothetical protein